MRRIDPEEVRVIRRSGVDPDALRDVAPIIEDVRSRGEQALREHSERFGDIDYEESLVLPKSKLETSFLNLPDEQQEVLTRVAGRIESFALAQRANLEDVSVRLPSGRAGQRWIPVDAVGAYAPGGRHPLPSSVLMTTIPARVAGVRSIWVASPRPAEITLAAAYAAGADGLVAAGGAQAIAALAFGTVSPASDLIVGPGNKWVTAAKKYLYGEVGIDGLAGPSEILIIADGTAEPALVAADLLAQAEHDIAATPSLISTDAELADAVELELKRQLSDLPTADVAARALGNGFVIVVADLDQAACLSDRLAPEHLALHVADPERLADSLCSYGSVFVGAGGAEVFADYGAGPNHVLPTGGTARYQSGLSVLTFLKSPTWLRLDDPHPLISDTALLARLEGLEAHARAAIARSEEK